MPSRSHQVGLSAIGHFSPSLVAGKLLTFGKCLVEDDRLVLSLGHEQGRPRNYVDSPLGCSRGTLSPDDNLFPFPSIQPRPRTILYGTSQGRPSTFGRGLLNARTTANRTFFMSGMWVRGGWVGDVEDGA